MSYTYRLAWSDIDRVWVATCDEHPGYAWMSPNDRQALESFKGWIEEIRPVPKEMSQDEPASPALPDEPQAQV